MPSQLCLLKFALAELFVQVSHSRRITLADRYGLFAAILEDAVGEPSLTDEERASIDRLLYAVGKGRFEIVDELSMLPA